MNKHPLISIIITTKNEERQIERLLNTIQKQDFTNYEVLCIDDSDSSETERIVNSYGYKFLKYGPERSAKRNEGIKRSTGKWIFWLDADMSLKVSTLKSCILQISKLHVDYLTIQEEIPAKSLFTKSRNFENLLLLNTVISVPRFINASMLKECGGFDEAMTGAEDWDMAKRLNLISHKKGILLSSDTVGIIHHEEDISYKRFLEKKQYYAVGCHTYERKWGSNDSDVRRQLKAFPRIIHLLTAKGNWNLIIKHPMLFSYLLFFKSLPSFLTYKINQ